MPPAAVQEGFKVGNIEQATLAFEAEADRDEWQVPGFDVLPQRAGANAKVIRGLIHGQEALLGGAHPALLSRSAKTMSLRYLDIVTPSALVRLRNLSRSSART